MLTAVRTLFALVLLAALPARAAEPPAVKGLYLLTDYPAVAVLPGTTATIALKLQNYGIAPERYRLSVEGVPAGWTATLLGGGQPVGAAMPATDQSVALQLRIDIPANAGGEAQTLSVTAEGQGASVSLPISVSLAKELPAKLRLDASLPALRGSARSNFEFQLSIKNDSGRNLVASMAASGPRNFETSFTEAYGSQELSSIPIEAGKAKDVKLKVRPPTTAGAGRYPVSVTVSAEDASAKTDLLLEIVGEPRLQLSGRDGLVSARAEAGAQTSTAIVIANTGSAPADTIELTGSGPNGWTVSFEPKTIESLAPGKDQEVQALITPTAKSLAGDYMVNLRAASRGEQASSQFRVTVTTSTLWGMAGVGIIGIALLLMVGAVSRFGRR